SARLCHHTLWRPGARKVLDQQCRTRPGRYRDDIGCDTGERSVADAARVTEEVMVQPLKLGGAQNSGATARVKRVNRLPVIVVIVLLVAFLGIIFFGLASRGLYFGGDSGPDTSTGNPASTYA